MTCAQMAWNLRSILIHLLITEIVPATLSILNRSKNLYYNTFKYLPKAPVKHFKATKKFRLNFWQLCKSIAIYLLHNDNSIRNGQILLTIKLIIKCIPLIFSKYRSLFS